MSVSITPNPSGSSGGLAQAVRRALVAFRCWRRGWGSQTGTVPVQAKAGSKKLDVLLAKACTQAAARKRGAFSDVWKLVDLGANPSAVKFAMLSIAVKTDDIWAFELCLSRFETKLTVEAIMVAHGWTGKNVFKKAEGRVVMRQKLAKIKQSRETIESIEARAQDSWHLAGKNRRQALLRAYMTYGYLSDHEACMAGEAGLSTEAIEGFMERTVRFASMANACWDELAAMKANPSA